MLMICMLCYCMVGSLIPAKEYTLSFTEHCIVSILLIFCRLHRTSQATLFHNLIKALVFPSFPSFQLNFLLFSSFLSTYHKSHRFLFIQSFFTLSFQKCGYYVKANDNYYCSLYIVLTCFPRWLQQFTLPAVVDKCIKFQKPLLIICLNCSKILIVIFMYILKCFARFII